MFKISNLFQRQGSISSYLSYLLHFIDLNCFSAILTDSGCAYSLAGAPPHCIGQQGRGGSCVGCHSARQGPFGQIRKAHQGL